jgi:hypothetical protein
VQPAMVASNHDMPGTEHDRSATCAGLTTMRFV